MNVRFLLQAGFFLSVLACVGCGPEAETGAVFSRYSAQVCAAPSPADTIIPDAKSIQQEEAPRAAVPVTALTAAGTDFLMGKFNPATHPDFVPVSTRYASRSGLYLQKETYAAFCKMWSAAKKDGINLTILSAARSFDYQKGIWERKWSVYTTQIKAADARTLKILEYSAMPGSSRHHWGTDIDLNGLDPKAFVPGGQYHKTYEWLQQHAHFYGFYQPYTAKDHARPDGYNEERWHWSYLPLATPLLRQYERSVADAMFTGFSGAETAPAVGIVQKYVLGVAPDCR
ncbi:MAG: D-alanyl-D-alanine carboxypeptidase family protein [Bacteroidetes bacterium]|nr:MAG: D-alanyl-D-alanine carboxypeptidase family protein [Bacteroidota bacterium]